MVSIPNGAGFIPHEMGWLPGGNGIYPMRRGVAPAAGGIYPAGLGIDPLADGIDPARRGMEPASGGMRRLSRNTAPGGKTGGPEDEEKGRQSTRGGLPIQVSPSPGLPVFLETLRQKLNELLLNGRR